MTAVGAVAGRLGKMSAGGKSAVQMLQGNRPEAHAQLVAAGVTLGEDLRTTGKLMTAELGEVAAPAAAMFERQASVVYGISGKISGTRPRSGGLDEILDRQGIGSHPDALREFAIATTMIDDAARVLGAGQRSGLKVPNLIPIREETQLIARQLKDQRAALAWAERPSAERLALVTDRSLPSSRRVITFPHPIAAEAQASHFGQVDAVIERARTAAMEGEVLTRLPTLSHRAASSFLSGTDRADAVVAAGAQRIRALQRSTDANFTAMQALRQQGMHQQADALALVDRELARALIASQRHIDKVTKGIDRIMDNRVAAMNDVFSLRRQTVAGLPAG